MSDFRIFCNKALDVLFKWGNLPVKTQNSLRLHIEVCLIYMKILFITFKEATAFNEDIAALITCKWNITIRS